MKRLIKSHKLDDVCYDIRGPVVELANQMQREGMDIIMLNTGNPPAFNLNAPDEVIRDVRTNLKNSEAYCDSKGIFPARKAIMQYYQTRGINGVTEDDIYIGNGSSELVQISVQALINDGDEILIPMPDYPLWTASVTLSGGRAVHYLCDEENYEYNAGENEEEEYALDSCSEPYECTELLAFGAVGAYCKDVSLGDSAALVKVAGILCAVGILDGIGIDYLAYTEVAGVVGGVAEDDLTVSYGLVLGILGDDSSAFGDEVVQIILFVNYINVFAEDMRDLSVGEADIHNDRNDYREDTDHDNKDFKY